MPRGDPPDRAKRATLRHFATLGAAVPFASVATRADDEADDGIDRRAVILHFIEHAPAVHFSYLRDALELGTGETQYHVRTLLEQDLIEAESDGEYRRFYPAHRFTNQERRILSQLRRETPRGIVRGLLENPAASAADLAADLDVSRAAISKAAGTLEEANVLERHSGQYSLVDPAACATLLIRYAESFDDATQAFADTASESITWTPSDPE